LLGIVRQSIDFAGHINKISKKYGKNWNFKRQRLLLWEYKNNTEFVPAWFVYESALFIGIDLFEIEENICEYISFSGKNRIYKPKLPVLVTPEFTAVAIHTMCDGHYTTCGKINYAQKEKKNLDRFVRLFGSLNHRFKDNYLNYLIFSFLLW